MLKAVKRPELENSPQLTRIEIDVPVHLVPYMNRKEDYLKRYALLIYPCIQSGEISHGKAAEILGMRKNELLDIYGELGIPYYNQTGEELNHDIQVLKNLRHNK